MRIEAGELTLDPGPVSPPYIAQSIMRLLEQQALEKGLTLDIQLAPELGRHLRRCQQSWRGHDGHHHDADSG